MKEQDLSGILIQKSKYYNPNCSYLSILKKYNIITMDQILDDSFLKILKKCRFKTRAQLNGLLTMLRYQYLGCPVCYDVLLDKEINVEYLKTHKFEIMLPLIDEKLSKKNKQERLELIEKHGNLYELSEDMPLADTNIYLMEFFGCHISLAERIMNKFMDSINEGKFPERIKVIDFLKWILEINTGMFSYVVPYINTYIEVYEKKRNIDLEKISFFKEQLSSLRKMSDDLDMEISELQQQIESLSNQEDKGDIKR